MKLSKYIIASIIVVAILTIGAIAFYFLRVQRIKAITSFDACKNAGYPILESFPEQCSTPDGRTFFNQSLELPAITVTGEFVCLPHKEQGEMQTLECAFGIKDGRGNHYALSDAELKYLPALSTGTKVTITGLFRSEQSSKYDIIGTILITSVEKQ